MHASADALPRSGKFIAPGTLPAPERVAQVRRALVDGLAARGVDADPEVEAFLYIRVQVAPTAR